MVKVVKENITEQNLERENEEETVTEREERERQGGEKEQERRRGRRFCPLWTLDEMIGLSSSEDECWRKANQS